MNTRQKVIEFLSKRYNSILEAKQNGTISWVAIKDEFHQETRFEINKDYFRNVFKTIIPTEVININSKKEKFNFLTGNENKDKGTKEFCFTADKIPTEEEIISHFNIDITKYRISQIWHKTTPGGKYSISVNLQANKIGQLSSEFEQGFEKFCEKQSLKALKPESKINNVEISKFEKNSTVVINLADLHLGKLVSEHETGERYNIDIAKEDF